MGLRIGESCGLRIIKGRDGSCGVARGECQWGGGYLGEEDTRRRWLGKVIHLRIELRLGLSEFYYYNNMTLGNSANPINDAFSVKGSFD